MGLGGKRELSAAYLVAARLSDLKTAIKAGASHESVYATVCAIRGFLNQRAEECLRVVDAGGDNQRLALVRGLHEALHKGKNATPAMGAEGRKIDREATKAEVKALEREVELGELRTQVAVLVAANRVRRRRGTTTARTTRTVRVASRWSLPTRTRPL